MDKALERLKLGLQLALTLAIVASGLGNAVKAAALLVLWLLTFWPLTGPELVLYAGACAFFSVMDIVVLKHGIFFFTHPDVLRMPWWEFFLYGFYFLHTWRMLKGPVPQTNKIYAWGLAILLAAAFGTINDQHILIIVSFALLFLGLAFFHEALDLAYTGYFIALGALFEYSGVYSGQWGYPGPPPTGVPLWFITMWGGMGLLLRRLIVPIMT